MKRICICIAFWITFVYPTIAQQVVHIRKVDTPPRIDGSLDDPAWLKANIFDDFKTLHPKAGLSPSERTTVYVMYNRDYLYVGVRCHDSEPDKIRAESTARDNPGHDDWVAFCLDSYNDELGAFFFMITPRGVQTDGTLSSSGSHNVIFITEWSSAARLTRDGWTAEMAIPFKNLPFSWQDRVVMGFKVSRFISRKAEEVDFPEILPQRTSQLAQFTKIEFSGIDRGKSSAAPWAPSLREMRRQRTQLGLQYDTLTYDDQLKIWGDASVFDYLAFPCHTLKPSKAVYHFVENLQEQVVRSVFERMEYSGGRQIKNLEQFLERTMTTAFIVIKNDTIIYEGYFNGFGRDSILTSFSVAKSFASTLVGAAIDEGLIGSDLPPINVPPLK
jgi:hypothetical protein